MRYDPAVYSLNRYRVAIRRMRYVKRRLFLLRSAVSHRRSLVHRAFNNQLSSTVAFYNTDTMAFEA